MEKWFLYCDHYEVDRFKPTTWQVCRFLRLLSELNMSLGAVNAARCALSVLLPLLSNGLTIGKDYWVCRAVKAAYHAKPPKARYAGFWDISPVFKLFERWGDNRELSLKQLSQKLVMLFLLISGQRGQAVPALHLDHLVWSEEGAAVFTLTVPMKTTRVGECLPVVTLKRYIMKRHVCVVDAIKEYIRRTESLRGEARELIVSFRKPHHPVSRDTISRWVIQVMDQAGIDTSVYKLHSTRGASTSAGAAMGLSSNVLLKHGSWKSLKSMATFYNQPIIAQEVTVGDAIRDALA